MGLFRRSPKDPRPQWVRVQEIADEAVANHVILAGTFRPSTYARRPSWILTYLTGQVDEMSQDAVAPRLRGVYLAAHVPCPDSVKREMKRSWE